MKKKLLTVLLAVVMVFGVFSLAACGDKVNPDSEYNYYGTKYSLDGDVKIEAATFQGVYKMFTTAGKFLLYVDSEGEGAATRFKAINKLAQDWDVTIYHFNPDLSGGYASTNTSKADTNIIKELTGVAASSQLKTLQDTLADIANIDSYSDIADHSLLAITGAAPSAKGTAEAPELVYNGKISKAVSYDKGAEAIAAIATKKPSYAQYKDGQNVNVPQAYNTSSINTMNLFADARLHMYNDDGTDAFTDEKTDVYVTVATYAQFAHLMDKNEGYFAVFFGGTWCPNTQAIAMLTNDLAKDYGIEKIYFFDPRLDDGVRGIWKAGVEEDEDGNKAPAAVYDDSSAGYLARNLNTRSGDATGAAYNFNYLYAQFLDEYLPDYDSEWNYGVTFNITSNGKVGTYTKMCVPNMMMFKGEGEGKAALVGLAEAEYSYPNTSVEGSAENVEWNAAIEEIFKANPYHVYNPIPDAPEADDSAAAGGSTGGSAAAPSAPAADAGGC